MPTPNEPDALFPGERSTGGPPITWATVGTRIEATLQLLVVVASLALPWGRRPITGTPLRVAEVTEGPVAVVGLVLLGLVAVYVLVLPHPGFGAVGGTVAALVALGLLTVGIADRVEENGLRTCVAALLLTFAVLSWGRLARVLLTSGRRP